MFLLFLENMKNYEPETRRRRSPEAPHPVQARAHPWPRLGRVRTPRSPSPSHFHLIPSFRYETFCYITPRTPRGPYIVFSSCFRFELFLPGFIFRSRATMSSSGPSKDSFFVKSSTHTWMNWRCIPKSCCSRTEKYNKRMFKTLKEKTAYKLGWKNWNKKFLGTRRWRSVKWT